MITHADLVIRAEKWLRAANFKVAFREFHARTSTGEKPDAIGWGHGVSVMIECKATRTDFLADKRKPFRRDPSKGMGDFRIYLCPTGLIRPYEIPEGWGLLYASAKQIRRIHGLPRSNMWTSPPFAGNKSDEVATLVSALRRIDLRGHLGDIYKPIGDA